MTEEDENENLCLIISSKREDLKLSIADVSNKLKISEENVNLFESEQTDFSSLTSFQRGYLRNYLSLLDLSVEVFSIAFNSQQSIAPKILVAEGGYAKQPLLNRTKMNVILLIVVVITVILFSF